MRGLHHYAAEDSAWSEMDLADLTCNIECGSSIAEALDVLYRAATPDELVAKAAELGLPVH